MTTRNITRDPAAFAIAVKDPEIGSVLSLRTGIEHKSFRLIEGRRYDRLVGGLRDVLFDGIRENRPRLVCPICSVAVRLVASPDKRFFFRHLSEDGSCPAVTRSGLDNDAIRAIKYNGARESDAHKRTKTRIAESLSFDPRFTDIAIETTWRAKEGKGLRRPDVQAAFFGGLRIAFEAQLTTTFLDVVRGRRAFYLENGALLIWILRRFEPTDRRMTEDDILFSNNSNILVVDDETWRRSKEAKRFMVRCHYREPYLDGDTRAERWQEVVVGFDELTLDVARQRTYLFDFDTRDAEVLSESSIREAHRNEELRAEIFSYWMERGIRSGLDQIALKDWWMTVEAAAQYNVVLPNNPNEEPGFMTAVAVLLSAKFGRPIGYKYSKLLQVAHQVAESHKALLVIFGFALNAYKTTGILEAEDEKGTWKERRIGFRRIIEAAPEIYFADLPYAAALRYLFPEVAMKIRG